MNDANKPEDDLDGKLGPQGRIMGVRTSTLFAGAALVLAIILVIFAL